MVFICNSLCESLKKRLVVIPGLFSGSILIETCFVWHIQHLNLVCNVYLSHSDNLYFDFYIFIYIYIYIYIYIHVYINFQVIILANKST